MAPKTRPNKLRAIELPPPEDISDHEVSDNEAEEEDEEQSNGEESEEDEDAGIGMDDVKFRSKVLGTKYSTQLDSRVVEPQRFADSDFFRKIGLHKHIDDMFKRLRLTKLNFGEPLRSYKCLSLEFFMTFEVTFKDPITCSMEMTFDLGNETRTLTVDELNNILGTSRGVRSYGPEPQVLQKFWYELTGRASFVSGLALAVEIVNPCIRLAHRILASVLYGRQESSKVRTCELICLYIMLHGGEINIGYELACKFQEIARSDKCYIGLGGIVGILARYFGVDLKRYTSQEPRWIDHDNLIATKQFFFDAANKKYSFYILQESGWYEMTRVECTCLSKNHWYRSWIKKLTPSWEELQVEQASGSDPVDRDSATFLNVHPQGRPEHPPRAAARKGKGRASSSQSDEIGTLRERVEEMYVTQQGMSAQISGILGTRETMAQQNNQMHRMMQEMYHTQYSRHFDPTRPWPPPEE